MSIRGRGPDTVIVQPRRVELKKGAPVYVDDGPPVAIKRCDVQSVREWATSEEELDFGVKLLDLKRVFSRFWPGDVNGVAYYGGELWEVVGNPQRFGRTRLTTHYLTTIRRIGHAEPPVVPPSP